MVEQAGSDNIRRTVTVQAPLERAFGLFTDELNSWWPKEYTWSREVLASIGIEPREGGRCTERSIYGSELDWGRVLVWQPPERLVLSWQIGPTRVPEPDPAKASEVEVRFLAAGPGASRVELEHRGFERHGAGANEYRAGMGSPQGWTYIVERYAALISRSAGIQAGRGKETQRSST